MTNPTKFTAAPAEGRKPKQLSCRPSTLDSAAGIIVDPSNRLMATVAAAYFAPALTSRYNLHERLVDALRAVVRKLELSECHHEETHRGGAIWTICDQCGQKWADDRGGFVPYKEPPELTQARAILAKVDKTKEGEQS